ncbi:MAG: hypothetical protein WD270_01665 [Acetobacterales bacterium]
MGGYQRAKLVAEMRDRHGLSANEVAERLAMSTMEVNRRYRAFKAMQQMSEDDDFGEFESPSLYPLFHEALSIPAIRDWLDWQNDSLRFEAEDELQKFYELITPREGENEETQPPKIKTYLDVRELRNILGNTEAKRVLLDPDRSMFDAITVYKRDQITNTWKTQVAEAIEALQSVGALELQNATEEDMNEVERLKEAASQIIILHQRLNTVE